MSNVQEIENAVNTILEVVSRRGDELSPQVKRELALLLNDLAGQMQEEQAQPQPPPVPMQPPPVPGVMQPPPVDEGADESVKILWSIAGGNEEAFVNYLRTFPDPALQSLLENPARVQEIINGLKQTSPQAAPVETAEGLEEPPYQSSNVEAFKYDPRTKKLIVKFHGGSKYQYDSVPPIFAKMFMTGNASCKTTGKNRWGSWWRNKSPTIAGALNEWIKKGGFQYHKIA